MTRTLSLFKYLLIVSAALVTPHSNSYSAPNFPFALTFGFEFSLSANASAKPLLPPAPFVKKSDVEKSAANVETELHSVSKKDLAALKALNEKYRKANSITMDISKEVKLGLIGSQRKSNGKLQISKGQLRMELEGSEHTLLVINKKNVFAVTYPDKTLKGAALQVIKGDVTSKKAKKQSQSSALANLLGPGGFLKSFKATGVQSHDEGLTYFLAPNTDSDMTRAQLKTSKDQKELRELHYWDNRDNETIYTFQNISFDEKLDPQIFNYTPPANADVMNL